jgi:hypothetical protein
MTFIGLFIAYAGVILVAFGSVLKDETMLISGIGVAVVGVLIDLLAVNYRDEWETMGAQDKGGQTGPPEEAWEARPERSWPEDRLQGLRQSYWPRSRERQMTYAVIMEPDYADFASKVEARLDAGWVLQGGVSVRTNEDGDAVYYQAVTYTAP